MFFSFRLFPARWVCFSIMTGLQPAKKNDLELCRQYRSIPVGILITRNTSFCSLPEGSKAIDNKNVDNSGSDREMYFL